MPKVYKFNKEQINGKWYTVCISHEHFPMIEHLKSGEYKVQGSDGKPRIEKEFNSAVKFAKETFKKMSKFNKKFKEE